MLLTLQGETLIARAWRVACEAFGAENCVVAIPKRDAVGPLGDELAHLQCHVFLWHGDEADVLGRMNACAAAYRDHPRDIVVRYTPDDWRKSVRQLQRAGRGRRVFVPEGGEAFTVADLAWWDEHVTDPHLREHIGYLVERQESVPLPDSIDTQADYDAVVAAVGK